MAAGRKKDDGVGFFSKYTKEDIYTLKLIAIGNAASVLVISILAFLVLGNYINLSGRVLESQLWDASYYHRLEFTMRYQVLGASWLLFSVCYVISKRVATKAFDPTTARDQVSLTIAKNNLSNSVEQFLISFFAQIIALSYLDETCVLKLIPLVNLYFIIGRIAFLVGYPTYREFGISLNFIPSFFLSLYNLYSFLKYVFL